MALLSTRAVKVSRVDLGWWQFLSMLGSFADYSFCFLSTFISSRRIFCMYQTSLFPQWIKTLHRTEIHQPVIWNTRKYLLILKTGKNSMVGWWLLEDLSRIKQQSSLCMRMQETSVCVWITLNRCASGCPSIWSASGIEAMEDQLALRLKEVYKKTQGLSLSS